MLCDDVCDVCAALCVFSLSSEVVGHPSATVVCWVHAQ